MKKSLRQSYKEDTINSKRVKRTSTRRNSDWTEEEINEDLELSGMSYKFFVR